METSSHCTVSRSRQSLELLWVLLLTLGVLLTHGYHPWAEDGGLYVSGVEFKLDPTLFPHERAFVTEHLGYSIFAPVLATAVRLSHLSLPSLLFASYLFTTALLLFAALRIAQRCFRSVAAQWTAVALIAAWWTLPIAATSVLLMDPYVTARSFSTPLSLLSIAAAMRPWRASEQASTHTPYLRTAVPPAITCTATLLLAAAFHPLMAGYALGLVLLLRLTIERRPTWMWIAFAIAVFLGAGALQVLATPESPSSVAAAHTRYYWFLSQWHWFEWMGLICPLAIFAAILRWPGSWTTPSCRALIRSSLALGLLSFGISLVYAHERLRAHTVARLQPLRAFLLLYVVMILLCGGGLATLAERLSRHARNNLLRNGFRIVPALFVLAMALLMFTVQRSTFPSSIHLELPGRENPNPWVQAFRWTRDHTPSSALFALDAHYINTQGEDAQTFRAIAQRSALPDFAKDGGQAANTPRLAPEWQRAVYATEGLSRLSDAQRHKHLQPFDVQWVILHRGAPTADHCPYENAVVKVCEFYTSAADTPLIAVPAP